MQAKKRYLLTSVGLACLLLAGYTLVWSAPGQNDDVFRLQPRAFHSEKDHGNDQDSHISAQQRRSTSGPRNAESQATDKSCRFETCFDITRCQNGFKVYVYPTTSRISGKYSEILRAIRESRYITDDPSEACILVPSVDTLDRDKLSDSYVPDIEDQIAALPHWNNGQNHFVFNLYAGTWPDYEEEDYGFSLGRAIIAQASMSETHYRPGFDVSFPLFHKEHAFKGGEPGFLTSNTVPPTREYTLAFKGKRYLTGIGSETRNSLYHIHNDKDIILLTTCKHGKEWRSIMDERCEKDNDDYDKYDYKTLLHKSTFCLVPRGRRLGSYRFLESLQAGCVPVLLSNNWVLPFSEVIDWERAVIWGDERLLLQIPSIVRSVSHADILSLRQQNQFLWDTYFSSIDKIIDTTLEILKDRVSEQLSRTMFMWNTAPGALHTFPEFSADLHAFPFYQSHLAAAPSEHFTAVIYARSTSVIPTSALYRLVKNIAKSKYLHKIVILWHCDTPPPSDIRWPVTSNTKLTHKHIHTLGERFTDHPEIDTDAILSLDEDASLLTDEVDFAFHVWQNFPTRLVGFVARSHYYDDGLNQWCYSSKWSNDYSIVLTDSAFYHRYYGYLYSHWLSPGVRQLVDQSGSCDGILMNYLVSHVTKLPPLKLTQRKHVEESSIGGATPSPLTAPHWVNNEDYLRRQHCMNAFTMEFGYMPLVRSSLRLDPLLFKDPVSRKKKKVPTATLR